MNNYDLLTVYEYRTLSRRGSLSFWYSLYRECAKSLGYNLPVLGKLSIDSSMILIELINRIEIYPENKEEFIELLRKDVSHFCNKIQA